MEIADEEGTAIARHPEADQVEEVKRSDQGWIGLQKLPGEALHPVPRGHGIEAAAQRPVAPGPEARDIDEQEQRHGSGLIDLHRVPRDAVAQIDAPRERGRRTISQVREPGEEAPPAADDDPESERPDEDRPGRSPYAADRLVDLDADDGAGESAQDRMGQCRERLPERVERPREPSPGDGTTDEGGEIAGSRSSGQTLGHIPQAPAIESGTDAEPRPPGQKIEDEVGPGRRRNMDHDGTAMPEPSRRRHARRILAGRIFIPGRARALDREAIVMK